MLENLNVPSGAEEVRPILCLFWGSLYVTAVNRNQGTKHNRRLITAALLAILVRGARLAPDILSDEASPPEEERAPHPVLFPGELITAVLLAILVV